LTKVEAVLIALLAAQAVIIQLIPQTPVAVLWVSRMFGVIAVVSGIIKAVTATTPTAPA
jgi:ABC-type Mn2+/Zn2+ transport system permease subunit